MKSTLLFLFFAAFLKTSFSDRLAKEPALADNCLMLNNKPRPYPCEFKLITLWFMGKNNEVLGKITPDSKQLKLPASKAVSKTASGNAESLFYKVSIDFRRVNTPAFTTPTYRLTKASFTDPISPGETTVINETIKVSPSLPSPGLRPNRVMFDLQLNYYKNDPVLVAPIRLVQLENPATFSNLTKASSHYRDRAEAWIDFIVSVDFSK